jgi:hypothetical protein
VLIRMILYSSQLFGLQHILVLVQYGELSDHHSLDSFLFYE